jgi:hypothetical protein
VNLIRTKIRSVEMLLFGFNAATRKGDNGLPVFSVLMKIEIEVDLTEEAGVKFWVALNLNL